MEYKDFWFIIAFVFISLIVFNNWFFNLGILTNGDWPYLLNEGLINHYLSYLNLWRTNIGFGNILLDVGQALTYTLYGFFYKFFGFSFPISERIIHLFPIAFFTPIFSFLLLRQYFKSKIASFVGSIVYSFNTYFMLLSTGHVTLLAAFTFAPLLVYLIHKTLIKKSFNYVILIILASFLICGYEPRSFYIIFSVIIGYFLFFTIFNFKILGIKNFKKDFFNMGILLIFILFLNSFWILGLMDTNSLTNNVLFDRPLFGNNFWQLFYSITLHHPWWTGGYITPFINQQIPFYFWLIPIFAFLGLILNKKNKYVLFFGIVALLGILLSKQVDHPFTNLYPWLFQNIPGFNAFREASKFYFLIALGYSVLIAGFVDWTIKNLNKDKLQKIIGILLICLIAFIFLWNTKPLITGEIGTLFIPREIPQDYLTLKPFILNQSDYFRTLWTPRDSRWGIYTNNHPKISNVDIIQSDWKTIVNYNENIATWPLRDQIIRIFNKPYSNNLLDVSSIKYIIIPIRDTENDDDFFKYYGNDTQFFIDAVNQSTYLTKISIGTKELQVYENEGYLDHIYASSTEQTLDNLNKSNIANIQYKQINPTKYTITFRNSELFYLYFSEAYHPQWKLTQNSHWYNGFNDKNYVFDNTHSKAYGFLNGWHVDPSKLQKNSNGEYELIIYFKPQSYFYIGLIISLTTLVLCITYLFLYWWINRKPKVAKIKIDNRKI